MSYDLVIRNGVVADGTGTAACSGRRVGRRTSIPPARCATPATRTAHARQESLDGCGQRKLGLTIKLRGSMLQVTLKNLARQHAPGLTPRAVLEKFAALQMVDVHLPTTDGRHLVLPWHTQPTPDHRLLLRQLDLRLPEQPAPRIAL